MDKRSAEGGKDTRDRQGIQASQSGSVSAFLNKHINKHDEGKPRADPGMKWGKTPSQDPPSYTPSEDSYSPEERERRQKMREKGINPDLKAEMDSKVYGKGDPVDGSAEGRAGGFWTKVGGTVMGGSAIK